MAASGGHLLVPKAMRLIRYAVEKTGRLIRDKIPQTTKPIEVELQPAYARVTQRQPVTRVGGARYSQNRWYSTHQALRTTIRTLTSRAGSHGPAPRASYPSSRTGTAVRQLTGRTPFASTLRPNLTGGTLCRSAGGYGLGGGRVGGARYFSHSPATPAQVVSNVSQAVRAFWISGQKVHYDGINPRSGEKRFRATSTAEEHVRCQMEASSAQKSGSFIDFKVSPTINAIGPLSGVPRSPVAESCADETAACTLNNAEMLSSLSVDFARALKDLAAIMNDLQHLAVLGDLPLVLENSTTLRVRFPGCDADTVECICRELQITRGIVGQDEDFDAANGTDMALLFPFAPSHTASEMLADSEPGFATVTRRKQDDIDWHEMFFPPHPKPTGSSPTLTDHLLSTESDVADEGDGRNAWVSSPSGYSSLHGSEGHDPVDQGAAMYFFSPRERPGRQQHAGLDDGSGYEGLEGIYKFIEECDRARS